LKAIPGFLHVEQVLFEIAFKRDFGFVFNVVHKSKKIDGTNLIQESKMHERSPENKRL